MAMLAMVIVLLASASLGLRTHNDAQRHHGGPVASGDGPSGQILTPCPATRPHQGLPSEVTLGCDSEILSAGKIPWGDRHGQQDGTCAVGVSDLP